MIQYKPRQFRSSFANVVYGLMMISDATRLILALNKKKVKVNDPYNSLLISFGFSDV